MMLQIQYIATLFTCTVYSSFLLFILRTPSLSRGKMSKTRLSLPPFLSLTILPPPLSLSTQGMKGPQDQDLFSACVGDLVMESREFEMLLGRIEPDGSRRPGCIDKFQKETSQVISFVAEGAEKRGLYEDAIRLHDLAKVCGCVWEGGGVRVEEGREGGGGHL